MSLQKLFNHKEKRLYIINYKSKDDDIEDVISAFSLIMFLIVSSIDKKLNLRSVKAYEF